MFDLSTSWAPGGRLCYMALGMALLMVSTVSSRESGGSGRNVSAPNRRSAGA
jgi:hypothetical protein